MNTPKKILAIQMARMGDLLQSVPLIHSIYSGYEEKEITLLFEERFRDIVECMPFVDKKVGVDLNDFIKGIIPSSNTLVEKYRFIIERLEDLLHSDFDIVYNLNYFPLSAFICNLLKTNALYGYRIQNEHLNIIKDYWGVYLFSMIPARRMNRLHVSDVFLRMGGRPHGQWRMGLNIEQGAEREASELLTDVGIGEGGPVIGLQPGASLPKKMWPKESFAGLADMLVKRYKAQVLIFGSLEEKGLADEIISSMNLHAYNLAGVSVKHLGAILKRCNLLVTNDTGPMHLSVAAGCQVVAIFCGNTCCHESGPYDEGHVVLEPNIECFPCPDDKDTCNEYICKRTIGPEFVFQVACKILDGGPYQGRDNSHTEKIMNGLSDISIPPDVSAFVSTMRPDGVRYKRIGGGDGSRLEDESAYLLRRIWDNVIGNGESETGDSASLVPDSESRTPSSLYNGLETCRTLFGWISELSLGIDKNRGGKDGLTWFERQLLIAEEGLKNLTDESYLIAPVYYFFKESKREYLDVQGDFHRFGELLKGLKDSIKYVLT